MGDREQQAEETVSRERPRSSATTCAPRVRQLGVLLGERRSARVAPGQEQEVAQGLGGVPDGVGDEVAQATRRTPRARMKNQARSRRQ
jgi:hypothetical protein